MLLVEGAVSVMACYSCHRTQMLWQLLGLIISKQRCESVTREITLET